MLVILYEAVKVTKENSNSDIYFVASSLTACPTTRSIASHLGIVGVTTHLVYKSYLHICRLTYIINTSYFLIYMKDGSSKKINLTTSQKLLIDTLVG